MADKLMYIQNDDTQNYPFRRIKLVVETLNLINQPIKVPKVVKPTNMIFVIIKLFGLV